MRLFAAGPAPQLLEIHSSVVRRTPRPLATEDLQYRLPHSRAECIIGLRPFIIQAMKPLTSFVCASCKRARLDSVRIPLPPTRTLTTTSKRSADQIVNKFSNILRSSFKQGSPRPRGTTDTSFLDSLDNSRPPDPAAGTLYDTQQPHRLHVYATKHNTHLTLTAPGAKKQDLDANDPLAAFAPTEPYKVLMSLSAGNIGFRKAGRGSYDAAYQLAAFVLKQIQERGLMREINKLNVVLRGFGAGREAVSKVILGAEGRMIRGLSLIHI